jgi:RNA polymerase sigma factor (sigma-70 family)
MPGRSSGADTLKHLQALFREGTLSGLTDGELMQRCASAGDDSAAAAFTALVGRHGPMVLRVCYQVLGNSHDAQDAFQATFLVLARKARSVRKYDSVASWLYGVADRVARQARAEAARRRVHERRRSELTALDLESVGAETRSETWPELHEEVALLPEKLRIPIVLCYLEGLTAEAAAQQLGCPRGTVLSRLSRARERLRERLTRRGVSLSTGLPLLATKSAVPDGLSHATVQAAIRITAGKMAAGTVPASVAALTEGVLRMMSRVRLIRVAGAILAIGAMSIGVGVVVSQTVGAPPRAARAGNTTPPVSSKDDPSRNGKERGAEIVVCAADMSRVGEDDGFAGMAAIDPETAQWRTIYKGLSLGPGHVSPDGRYIVYSAFGRDVDEDQVGIWVYDMNGEKAPRRISDQRGNFFWSHEGRQVVISTTVGANREKFETWRVNADGTGLVKLPIPDGDLVLDSSSDGNWLATRTIRGKAGDHGRLTLVHPDGTDARYLTEGSAKDDLFSLFKISPDSRQVAYVNVRTVDGLRRSTLFVVDIDGRNRRAIPLAFDPGDTVGACWSPDGSRLALNPIDSRTKEGWIAIVNLDGTNFRKLPLPPGRWNLLVCGWNTLTPGLKVSAPDETLDLKTPRGRYEALCKEINKASRDFREEYQKAKTDEERSIISREKSFQPRRYIGRFLEIAESAPNDPVAIDALIWIIRFGFDGPEFSRAIDRLAENHVQRAKVGQAALTLGHRVSPSAEKLLRAVIEKYPDRSIKGLAYGKLGRYLKHQAEQLRAIREDPESVKRWETMFLEEGADKEYFSRFINRDPDALMKEAEAVLERTLKEFGDVNQRGGSLQREARADLFEIRNLCVGKPAPEIAGKDIDGKPLKLSDFKGKVVVVDFWTISCGSCRDMNAYERSLMKRMQGKPLALLGVNGDEDKDQLNAWIKQEQITWRSWWDGDGDARTKGAIASQFNTSARPTIYILDQRGVIRHKFLGFPGAGKLDASINALVEALENDGVVSRIHQPRS